MKKTILFFVLIFSLCSFVFAAQVEPFFEREYTEGIDIQGQKFYQYDPLPSEDGGGIEPISPSRGGGGSSSRATSGISSGTCTAEWECTEWSLCVDGTQERTCADINNCGTLTGRPQQKRSCQLDQLPKEIVQEEPLPIIEKPTFKNFILIAAISLALAAIILAVIIHNSKTEQALSTLPGIVIPLVRIENLRRMVQKELAKGYSPQDIQKVLLKKGWPKQVVEDVLKL